MSIEIPPKITDKFHLVSLCNGQTLLLKGPNKNSIACAIPYYKSIDKITYADLTNSITQRMYDYHFYFENFINTSTTNSTALQQALANLMDLFSNDLTSFIVNSNGTPVASFTSKAEVQTFFTFLQANVFQGFTLHTAPNVRVRPICNSAIAQASMSSGEVDYSGLNLGSGSNFYTSIGYYNFTWRYEHDGVWRIVTWTIDNRLQYIQPTATLTPTSFRPYTQDPPSNCGNGC